MRIKANVKRILIFCVLLATTVFGTEGNFAGQIIRGPDLHDSKKWIYVQGPHGSSRRVDVSTAKIFFNASVEKKDRDAKPENGIREGAQVRVTASQDSDGEWKASSVEIVKAGPPIN